MSGFSKMGFRTLCRTGGLVAVALAAIVFVLGGAGSAQAQVAFSVQITVDENGNGLFVSNAPFSAPLVSALQADPGPGGLASALTYDLGGPPSLTAGDILVDDFGTSNFSDVIRFNPTESVPGGQGPGDLVFYSLDALGSLADTGGPTANYTNVITLSEDANGELVYTPTSGEPGFVAGLNGGGIPVTYTILSDAAVPEPASMLLFGSALAGLGLARRRRR